MSYGDMINIAERDSMMANPGFQIAFPEHERCKAETNVSAGPVAQRAQPFEVAL